MALETSESYDVLKLLFKKIDLVEHINQNNKVKVPFIRKALVFFLYERKFSVFLRKRPTNQKTMSNTPQLEPRDQSSNQMNQHVFNKMHCLENIFAFSFLCSIGDCVCPRTEQQALILQLNGQDTKQFQVIYFDGKPNNNITEC